MKRMLLRSLVALVCAAGALAFMGSVHRDCEALAAHAERAASRRSPALSANPHTGPVGPWPCSARDQSDKARLARRARYLARRERDERRRQESFAQSAEQPRNEHPPSLR